MNSEILTATSVKLLTDDLVVAYTLVAMLLISPLAWIYYFSLLLIPCAIIFYWNQYIFRQEWLNLFLALALLLSSMPHLLLKPRQIINGYDIFLWSGCYFYALCILGVLIFNMQRLSNRLSNKDTLKSQMNIGSPLLVVVFTTAFLPSFLGILTIIYLLLMTNGH